MPRDLRFYRLPRLPRLLPSASVAMGIVSITTSFATSTAAQQTPPGYPGAAAPPGYPSQSTSVANPAVPTNASDESKDSGLGLEWVYLNADIGYDQIRGPQELSAGGFLGRLTVIRTLAAQSTFWRRRKRPATGRRSWPRR